MFDIFSRFKAKLKEFFYEIPLPNFVKKLEPKTPFVNDDVPHEYDDLPDNFEDINLEKTNKVYHLKLKDLMPYQWMQVGTTLRNMAYEDPDYGHDYDGDHLPGEPLPPPPPPTEYQKGLQGPTISINVKNLSWVDLEEIGDTLYDMGWHSRKDYDLDDYDSLPQKFERCDEFPDTDAENFEEELFDPDKRLEEEVTEIKRITNSDVIPGIEKVPWKDDAELWLENPHPESPPWDKKPQEDFITQGKTFPLHSFMS